MLFQWLLDVRYSELAPVRNYVILDGVKYWDCDLIGSSTCLVGNAEVVV